MRYLKLFESNKEIYNIVIHYETGNSYGRENTSDLLEFDMTYEEVIFNEKSILEHEKMVGEKNSWRRKESEQEILAKYCHRDWFVYKEKDCVYYDGGKYQAIDLPLKRKLMDGETLGKFIDGSTAEHCIILKSMGKDIQLTCFWIGYFETLYDIEIIKLKETDE